MASFKDLNGDEWSFVLTTGLVAEVKRETGVNLALIAKGSTTQWVEVIFDPDGKLAEILWALCARQAKERGVTPEEFPYRLDGPTLEAAGSAIARGVSDFFPNSRIGKAVREGWEKAMRQVEDQVIAKLEKTLTDSGFATNSPASVGSIPEG